MINGIDISGWVTIKDAQALFNDQLVIDFAYVRAHDGYRDDIKFTKHRDILVNAKCKNGSILWGPYMFLGYSGNIGSQTWKADAGDYQAQNCWNLATAGGKQHQLPVAIDLERVRWWDGANYQMLPLPKADYYCDHFLVPAIEYLKEKQGGLLPVIYSNADIILNYLAPVLAKYPVICQCPLWFAYPTKAEGTPPYMESIANKTGWKALTIHQFALDVKDYPGINDVDLNRGVGTRAQWKAWGAGGPVPVEGAVEPPPIEPPPAEPPASDLEARVKALEDWKARVQA